MVTDYDHITALTNMMENIKREAEAKVRDIEEVIASLKKAPKLISEVRQLLVSPISLPEKVVVKPAPDRSYAKNQPALLKEYLEGLGTNEVISVNKVIEYFNAHGVTGKRKSQWSYIYSLLKALAASKDLAYEKNVGYYKPDRFHPLADELA